MRIALSLNPIIIPLSLYFEPETEIIALEDIENLLEDEVKQWLKQIDDDYN